MTSITNLNENGWKLAFADSLEALHNNAAALHWEAVRLPNHVQTSAFGMPKTELYQGLNTQKLTWMAEKFWIYRSEVVVPAVPADHEACLVFHGIDYDFEIKVNGKRFIRKEGMWSKTEVALDEGRHLIEVVIYPPCNSGAHPEAFDYNVSLREHLKVRFSKGWDWAPTLVTSGIWQGVELFIRPRLRVLQAQVETRLTNAQRAECTVTVRLSERVGSARIRVCLDSVEQDFAVINTDVLKLPLKMESPTLWWPNGMGVPALVDLRLVLHCDGRSTDTFTIRTGLREIRKQPAQGQKSIDTPHQLLMNGRKVFIRGANWVPMDSCFADCSEDRYELFLSQFARANFNMLRVWGGGLIEKPAFYEICDRLGLMIMQEFPLACEKVPETERFLQLVSQEMNDFVPRLNRHPSIVLWTGGNEHYHFWDDMDSGTEVMKYTAPFMGEYTLSPQRRAGGVHPYTNKGLSLIGGLFEQLDGTRPYQPTSGMEGEGEPHGIWNWDPRLGDFRMRDFSSFYDFWNQTGEHFYSEASVEGIANRKAIEAVCGSSSPTCPDPADDVWIHHKAFRGCWPIDRHQNPDPESDLWLDLASIKKLFGPVEDLNTLIRASHWLQAEGARYIVEELRRKMPHTCGFIWWGANEPWPNLAGNQLIDYYGDARPALVAIATAFMPTILSLRYEGIQHWRFKPQLWISHDGAQPFSGRYLVSVRTVPKDPNAEKTYEGTVSVEPYASVYIRELDYSKIENDMTMDVHLALFNAEDLQVHDNAYRFTGEDGKITL